MGTEWDTSGLVTGIGFMNRPGGWWMPGTEQKGPTFPQGWVGQLIGISPWDPQGPFSGRTPPPAFVRLDSVSHPHTKANLFISPLTQIRNKREREREREREKGGTKKKGSKEQPPRINAPHCTFNRQCDPDLSFFLFVSCHLIQHSAFIYRGITLQSHSVLSRMDKAEIYEVLINLPS